VSLVNTPGAELDNPELERLVLRTAFRLLGRWEEAQDVAQDAFLRAHQTTELDGERLRAWLYRVTVNLCRDRHRRGRFLVQWPETAPEPFDQGLDPEAAAGLEQQRRILHAALKQLPPREQAAIQLHYLDGLGAPEIAERLGISEGTVRSNLSTGRVRLKRLVAAALAAALSVGVGGLLWVAGWQTADVAAPAPLAAKLPVAPLKLPKPTAPVRVAARRVETTAPARTAVVKIVTDDPDVVIYWTMDLKGEGNQ
jgi:RNA polymerase sigma factor (sigma-70 family)